jgi:hypothetical protein
LTKTPLVLPRSSTRNPPSAAADNRACSRDSVGSSTTTSACGERPIVLASPRAIRMTGVPGEGVTGRSRIGGVGLFESDMEFGAEEHRPIVVARGPLH